MAASRHTAQHRHAHPKHLRIARQHLASIKVYFFRNAVSHIAVVTGSPVFSTKPSFTQAFVLSKHLQNQILPFRQVYWAIYWATYWSIYWVITFNFHSPLLQAQEKTQGHSQQDYKAWQHGGATSLSYLCYFLYSPTHHLPPFLYETHSSHSHG